MCNCNWKDANRPFRPIKLSSMWFIIWLAFWMNERITLLWSLDCVWCMVGQDWKWMNFRRQWFLKRMAFRTALFEHLFVSIKYNCKKGLHSLQWEICVTVDAEKNDRCSWIQKPSHKLNVRNYCNISKIANYYVSSMIQNVRAMRNVEETKKIKRNIFSFSSSDT